MAVAVGFGGGVVSSNLMTSERQHLVDEVAEYHAVQSRETRHLVEVPATQTDDLTTWLGRRLDRHLAVPDLTQAGLNFAGGRMVVIDRKPAATFIYTRDNGPPVAICIIKSGGTASGVRIDRRGALNLSSWTDGTYTLHHRRLISPTPTMRSARRARRPATTDPIFRDQRASRPFAGPPTRKLARRVQSPGLACPIALRMR